MVHGGPALSFVDEIKLPPSILTPRTRTAAKRRVHWVPWADEPGSSHDHGLFVASSLGRFSSTSDEE